VIYKRQF